MPIVNRLLDTLPRNGRDRFLEDCEPVSLVLDAVLCERDKHYRHVYFPLSGFISLVATTDRHPPLEIALIGNEGMLGATIALGVNGAGLQGIVQGAGTAWRMPTSRFRRALRESPALSGVVRRYLFVVLAQLSHSTACARFHEAEARLARWLLMTLDRAHADRFHLTHQYLADMLGVRRSAVTIAAGALQRRNLIRYVRGNIRVVDRQGLEAASCECYHAGIGDYERMFD
jgi:CRP-like cAMP-binding protein